jgi:SAM-dependent methyltransferase
MSYKDIAGKGLTPAWDPPGAGEGGEWTLLVVPLGLSCNCRLNSTAPPGSTGDGLPPREQTPSNRSLPVVTGVDHQRIPGSGFPTSNTVPRLKLSDEVRQLLRCPRCSATLAWKHTECVCLGQTCGRTFPIIAGIPILIDEAKSLFDVADFVEGRETTFRSADRLLKDAFRNVMPRLGHNIHARRNYSRFAEMVTQGTDKARVLIVGGSVLGKGMEPLASHPGVELVETDLALGGRTALVCDGHDLPFVDESFDGVIVQAVLEHVLDPQRCVSEIHRVLKSEGLVYAETPFMQQVHMGPYDFTRFSHLGHRRLFRQFEEIASGASGGAGMALAWSWQYFLLSFAVARLPRAILRGLAALTAFPLKYFDYVLIDRPGSLDAASGIYFLGRKSEGILADRVLVRGYRGAI